MIMGLTMKNILDKYPECNKFSLTGAVSRYNITISREEYEKQTENLNMLDRQNFLEQYNEKYNITEEEFLKAIENVEYKNKEEKRKYYENNKEQFKKYPSFDELYEEIKKECYDFDCEENREYYLNKRFDDKKIEKLKMIGMTDEKINEMKKGFFYNRFIADHVGKTTKYGKEHKGFFWNLYHEIGMNIDRRNDKESYCINNGKNPIEQIPEELKKHFLYYEISFFNSVTTSGGLMINYYFELNNETKEYLLKFKNDFCLNELEDLTLYKDDEIKFYSCTHEYFNSIDIDYKKMSNEEILNYIKDEVYDEDYKIIIEIINKLINMKSGTRFSFAELGINDDLLIDNICKICDEIKLRLVMSDNKENNRFIINKDLEFQEQNEMPVIFCKPKDIIEKRDQ